MKKLFVSILTAGLFVWGASTVSAQQVVPPEIPPGQEIPPDKKIPPKTETLPLLPEPGCAHGHPATKILILEEFRPVQILLPREVITEVKKPTLAIVYKDVKREVIDFELKPRDYLQQVPCTVMQPCQEVDPHTGKVCTVMKPVTQMKLEKVTVFESVPVKRVLIDKVASLEPVEEIIPKRTILLEWHTELQKNIAALPAPTHVYPTEYILGPQSPGCLAPGHLPHHP